MRRSFTLVIYATTLVAVLVTLSSAETDNDAHPAALTILKFNEAVTSRDMDTALSLLADGGIQFNLHPAHPACRSTTR